MTNSRTRYYLNNSNDTRQRLWILWILLKRKSSFAKARSVHFYAPWERPHCSFLFSLMVNFKCFFMGSNIYRNFLCASTKSIKNFLNWKIMFRLCNRFSQTQLSVKDSLQNQSYYKIWPNNLILNKSSYRMLRCIQ